MLNLKIGSICNLDGEATMGPYPSPILDNWHNCDREIGSFLHLIPRPYNDWNGGKPSWALIMHKAPTVLEYVPIKFCPICGEELPDA